jgi:hypothetical protein
MVGGYSNNWKQLEGPMAKRSRVKISDVEFVAAWMKVGNYDDLVAETGLTKASIQVKAVKLRKAGVKLPKYGRVKVPIDVKGLNELISKASKKK